MMSAPPTMAPVCARLTAPVKLRGVQFGGRQAEGCSERSRIRYPSNKKLDHQQRRLVVTDAVTWANDFIARAVTRES